MGLFGKMTLKEFEIDLSSCSGYVDEEEDKIIRGQLKKQALFNAKCIYSVFNGNRKKQILETGNYRNGNPNSIFAFTKNELGWETEEPFHNHIKSLTRDYNLPAIAIYDKNQFNEDYAKGGNYEYFFKNPNKKLEALLGIAFLKF